MKQSIDAAKYDLTTLGGRIKYCRKLEGMSQAKLAEIVGISQQSIFEIERNLTKHTSFIENFARALNRSKEWLQFGGWFPGRSVVEFPCGSKDMMQVRLVPILTHEQTIKWCLAPGSINVTEITNFKAITVKVSEHSFGLKVTGDSMAAPMGLAPSFTQGMHIIIDPTLEPKSGNFIVAHLKNSDDLTFRKYVEESGKKYLMPLNSAYPLLELDKRDKIIGLVVAYVGELN